MMGFLSYLRFVPVVEEVVKTAEEAVSGEPIAVPIKGVHLPNGVWDFEITGKRRNPKPAVPAAG